MRTFGTGATRNSDTNKPDFEGFFSPLVLGAFGQYMHEHRRTESGGQLRDSDNWQLGMGLPTYMKSLWRHLYQAWRLHRGYTVLDWDSKRPITMKEALCGIIFNAQGYLHELLAEDVKKAAHGRWHPLPDHDDHDIARMEHEGGQAN